MNERIAELEIGIKVTTRDNSRIEETCSNFEQQLTEAKRGNLRQRVEDMNCGLNAWSYEFCVQCSNRLGVNKEAMSVKVKSWLKEPDMGWDMDRFINWLIEQGVDA